MPELYHADQLACNCTRLHQLPVTGDLIQRTRLIIGVARGITVILNNGLIAGTVLYYEEQAVGGLSSVAVIFVWLRRDGRKKGARPMSLYRRRWQTWQVK